MSDDRNDEFEDGFGPCAPLRDAAATIAPTLPPPPAGDCPQCRAALGGGADGSEKCLCPACGYCTHPSQSAKDDHWGCNACGAKLHPLTIPEGIP